MIGAGMSVWNNSGEGVLFFFFLFRGTKRPDPSGSIRHGAIFQAMNFQCKFQLESEVA
jgi:hypothetical protein